MAISDQRVGVAFVASNNETFNRFASVWEYCRGFEDQCLPECARPLVLVMLLHAVVHSRSVSAILSRRRPRTWPEWRP